ncbi:hypothetical protein SAMN05519103_04004 [Rhizobiales bacterium GAS113]|nr:hypothetical protein SAMN05519103_04004 [Rhizobiales bacterium GAS113]
MFYKRRWFYENKKRTWLFDEHGKELPYVTAYELACTVGSVVGALFAGAGALLFVETLIGHRWGDMPELAGGVFFVFVLTFALRGVDATRNERLEPARQAAQEYFRKLNSN